MLALPPWKDLGAIIASPSAKCQPRCLEKEITPLTPHTARIYSGYQYPAPHHYDAVMAPILPSDGVAAYSNYIGHPH
jgi:hypothetical protein